MSTTGLLESLGYTLEALEAAARFARISEEGAVANDANTQIVALRTGPGAREARGVRVRRGAWPGAVRLAERTDALDDRGDTLMDLADVLRVVGRRDEAATAVAEAQRLYERKGNVVSGAKAAALLAGLTTSSAR